MEHGVSDDTDKVSSIENLTSELHHDKWVPIHEDIIRDSQKSEVNILEGGHYLHHTQAAAAISGQYYLHQINVQLDSISEKLDELIDYHNDERIGLLLTVKERLLKIANKQNVDIHDIGEVRALMKDSLNVYSEYRVRLSRQCDALANFEPKVFFVKDKITALEEKIKEINFTTKIVYEAEQLSIQAELSEIAIRMKLGDKIALIQELTNQMKEHCDSSFNSTIAEFIIDEYRPIVRERYRKFGEKYLLKHPERLEQINNLVSLSELTSMDSNIGELSQKLILEQNKKQEILYLPSEDLVSQRIFVALDE
ncbi:hypothetical protein [Enterococcus silesiacus]|uniref:hypothetical protein n=1 Tax=Enterococcus silesiacus TaxID=332949 RepID=UPI001C264C3D|nr:hypothetical protein [Enterococcus silesiacus]